MNRRHLLAAISTNAQMPECRLLHESRGWKEITVNFSGHKHFRAHSNDYFIHTNFSDAKQFPAAIKAATVSRLRICGKVRKRDFL